MYASVRSTGPTCSCCDLITTQGDTKRWLYVPASAVVCVRSAWFTLQASRLTTINSSHAFQVLRFTSRASVMKISFL